jgi:xanthine/CO dehydrogenase XdhC/CoxF family maturation factor
MAEDVRPALRQARDAGLPLALATLIGVEGGGPRPTGTQMVFADGIAAGYFSGGCVESDVADHAYACLADGEPRTLVYGEGSPWPDIRLLCGARIEIFVERVAPHDPALAELLAAELDRRPVLLVSDGRTRACGAELEPWPEARVEKRYEPRPRLVVVGGDPTALAIAQLGAQAEFETTLVRPKGPQSRRRFRASPTCAANRPRRWRRPASTPGRPWRSPPTTPTPTMPRCWRRCPPRRATWGCWAHAGASPTASHGCAPKASPKAPSRASAPRSASTSAARPPGKWPSR